MKMLALAAALVVAASASVSFATGYPRCSTAGDQTSRPVYKRVNGRVVFVGYECVQDNRGSGGGVRF